MNRYDINYNYQKNIHESELKNVYLKRNQIFKSLLLIQKEIDNIKNRHYKEKNTLLNYYKLINN